MDAVVAKLAMLPCVDEVPKPDRPPWPELLSSRLLILDDKLALLKGSSFGPERELVPLVTDLRLFYSRCNPYGQSPELLGDQKGIAEAISRYKNALEDSFWYQSPGKKGSAEAQNYIATPHPSIRSQQVRDGVVCQFPSRHELHVCRLFELLSRLEPVAQEAADGMLNATMASDSLIEICDAIEPYLVYTTAHPSNTDSANGSVSPVVGLGLKIIADVF